MSDFEAFLAEQGEAPLRSVPSAGATFLSELKLHELKALREAVKRVYMRHYPVEFFTDREADRMIEALAPDVAERLIKARVDGMLERRDGSLNHGFLRLDE